MFQQSAFRRAGIGVWGSTSLVVPESYRVENLTEFSQATTITTTSATCVYKIDIDSSIMDGTNQATCVQLLLSLNDFLLPTGSTEAIEVALIRTSDPDGTPIGSLSPGSEIVYIGSFLNGSIAVIPYIHKWSTLDFKIATAQSGSVVNTNIMGVYYTPLV